MYIKYFEFEMSCPTRGPQFLSFGSSQHSGSFILKQIPCIVQLLKSNLDKSRLNITYPKVKISGLECGHSF